MPPPAVPGTVTIHYSLSDGSGASSVGSVALSIASVCREPAKGRVDHRLHRLHAAHQHRPGAYALSGHIVDGSVSGAGLTGPTGTYTPPAGMNSSVTVTFDVENGCHQTDTGVLTIDVNRAPVAGSIDRNVSPGGAAVTLLASDMASDPDGEPLTITSISGNPAWVGLGSSANGPMISASPPAGTASGTYTFNATVQDPGGLTAVATINLIISNQPPTAVADAYYTEASLLTFDPTTNDFDTEAGPLTVQTVAVVDGPATIVSRTGNWITVSLGHGVSDFNYTIVDSGGLTSSSTIAITSNRSPTVPDVSDTTNQPTIDLYLEPTGSRRRRADGHLRRPARPLHRRHLQRSRQRNTPGTRPGQAAHHGAQQLPRHGDLQLHGNRPIRGEGVRAGEPDDHRLQLRARRRLAQRSGDCVRRRNERVLSHHFHRHHLVDELRMLDSTSLSWSTASAARCGSHDAVVNVTASA